MTGVWQPCGIVMGQNTDWLTIITQSAQNDVEAKPYLNIHRAPGLAFPYDY